MLLSARHLRFYKVSQLVLLIAAICLIHPAHSSVEEQIDYNHNNVKHAAKNNHVYIETLKHDYKVSTDNSKYGSDSVERDAMKKLYQKSKSNGNVEWVTSFGSLGDDSVQAILPDDSGRIFLAGVYVGDLSIEGLPTVTSNGGYDFFVLTVSANGTMESIYSFGGDGDDWANSMDWNPDGNITIVGRFTGTWNTGVGVIESQDITHSDIFLLKITPIGEPVWVLQVGGPADDNANDVAVIQDTGFIIVVGSFQQYIDFGAIGSTAYAMGSDDMLILWVHPDGFVSTYKAYGSSGADSAMGVALSVTLGQIGICASYSGYIEMEGGHHSASDVDVLIILYWNNATYIDSTSFGSGVDDGFEDVVVDETGNVYVAGYYTDGQVSSQGGRDIVVIKFTEKAAFLWYKLFGGPNDDMAYAIGVDDGNVFIVGSTGGDIDFGTGVIASQGSTDIFVIKLDPDGNPLEALTWGGLYNDTGREVAIVNGSPIIAGTFVNSIEIGSTTMESKGATDMILFQVAAGGSGGSGDKNTNITAIAAGVVIPVVVLSAAGVVAFVFVKRRQAYRKNVLAVARASEMKLPGTPPEANYQPVIAAENMSNQSLNFSMASHNSSNQSFRDPNSNYSALNGSTSMEHPYESLKGGPMSMELSEAIKAQGLGEWSNSSWMIDFRQIQLQQKIGSGAFGAVFKAIWRGVPVAVKQSNTELAIQDFISEAEILTKLRPHPNITQFLGVCPSPFCLVFEFVPNGSLFSFLMNKSKEMDINLKIRILRGVVAGMVHLHSEGLVHRDLAARNILLDGTFTPKVCDFGLSRATGGATMGHTASEIGPIKWMAPEAILKRIYSPKTDIWSFGVVIFEVLERQVPYPDLSVPQVAAYITQISLLQSLSENHKHPEGLIHMMETCLQLDPEKRPTFEDLIQQFDESFGQQH